MINHVKTYRKKQGLTQTDLANRAELNIRQIQKIENGEVKTENITLKTMQAIAQALNVKIDDLISRSSPFEKSDASSELRRQPASPVYP